MEDLWVPKSRLECCEKEKSEIERERNELETENKRCRAQLAEQTNSCTRSSNVAVIMSFDQWRERRWKKSSLLRG